MQLIYKQNEISGGGGPATPSHIPWQLIAYHGNNENDVPSTEAEIHLSSEIFPLSPEVGDVIYILWYTPSGNSEKLYICLGGVTAIEENSTITLSLTHATPVNSGVQSDSVDTISALTQDDYEAIPTKDERTVYILKG